MWRIVPVRLTARYRSQSRQESDNLESCGMLFFSSLTPLGMPKKNGIPKSLLADIKSVKTRLSGLERPKAILSDIGSLKSRLANLEKAHASINKDLKNVSEALKRQDSTIAQLGKKPAKKEKRKPSEYNLFLKDKMSAGMSMVETGNPHHSNTNVNVSVEEQWREENS